MDAGPPSEAPPARSAGLVVLHAVGLLGAVLLAVGCGLGLLVAPREAFMGDVFRIAYIHAPTAGALLVSGGGAFVFAVGTAATRGPRWDGLMEACLEVAVLMVTLLLIQGAIFARPTWGSYWSGDPRFFATAAFGLATAGVLTLRAFIEAPARRAGWSAAATLAVVFVLPVLLKSVEWWPSIHPPSPDRGSLAAGIAAPLTVNFAAMGLITVWLVIQRARVSWARAGREPSFAGAGPIRTRR